MANFLQIPLSKDSTSTRAATLETEVVHLYGSLWWSATIYLSAIIIRNTSLPVFQHLKAHQFPNENLFLFPWLSLSIPLLLYSPLFITMTLLPDITEQFWIKFEVKASYKTNLLYYDLSQNHTYVKTKKNMAVGNENG